ncbi:MAG: peptide chain release factor 2 [Actinomycetota bacterium]|nr:peptide chain release factor 2 [Actinomycetota bacterium]
MITDQSERLNALAERIDKIGITFDIDSKRAETLRLEAMAAEPSLWADQTRGQEVMRELGRLKDDILAIERIDEKRADLAVLNELALAEDDGRLAKELEEALADLDREVDEVELKSWFTGEFDDHDAVVTIHPGAGGVESQDWAEMLLRMYLRWADKKAFKTEITDFQQGDGAGIKSVTFTAKGPYAFGHFRPEKGVHRLVRISPFDSSSRRHTSFSSVDVTPLIDDEAAVEIDPKDLRIETYRASGAGGQHVNVTDSAVRITHIPTGVVAQCQSERSQFQNKDTAMQILKARLFELEEEKKRDEMDKLRGEKKDIAWGSQIRSYVLHPYSLVKDHRINLEKGNIQGVLDGDLDEFIVAYYRAGF